MEGKSLPMAHFSTRLYQKPLERMNTKRQEVAEYKASKPKSPPSSTQQPANVLREKSGNSMLTITLPRAHPGMNQTREAKTSSMKTPKHVRQEAKTTTDTGAHALLAGCRQTKMQLS